VPAVVAVVVACTVPQAIFSYNYFVVFSFLWAVLARWNRSVVMGDLAASSNIAREKL
jgi:hypothetical protein